MAHLCYTIKMYAVCDDTHKQTHVFNYNCPAVFRFGAVWVMWSDDEDSDNGNDDSGRDKTHNLTSSHFILQTKTRQTSHTHTYYTQHTDMLCLIGRVDLGDARFPDCQIKPHEIVLDSYSMRQAYRVVRKCSRFFRLGRIRSMLGHGSG